MVIVTPNLLNFKQLKYEVTCSIKFSNDYSVLYN